MPPNKQEGSFNNENESLPSPAKDMETIEWLEKIEENILTYRSLAQEGKVLNFGTTEMKSSSGRVLEVNSLWWPKNDESKELEGSRLMLFTIDKLSRKLAAMRSIEFERYVEDYNSPIGVHLVSAGGMIASMYRGIGAGSATDEVLVEVLKKIATYATKEKVAGSKQVAIHWEVQDTNKDALEALKFQLQKAQNSGNDSVKIAELEAAINEKKEERERWLSMYQRGGKFSLSQTQYTNFNSRVGRVIRPEYSGTEGGPTIATLDKYDLLTEKVRQALQK